MPAPAPQGAQQATEYVIFDDFSGGMDTQAARLGLPDKSLAWLENLQPIAPNLLTGVQGPTGALATLGSDQVATGKLYFEVLGQQGYVIAFMASGAAWAIPVSGSPGMTAVIVGAAVQIAPMGTFSPTGGDVTSYTASRLLFADSKAGYATWDGTLFVQQGGVSPNFVVTAGGSGYTSGATVAITGGSGSGATATATVVGGVVTAIALTAAGSGYKAGDSLTVTIPAVSAGSGATANGHVWPFIAAPTTIAVAFGRVWLGGARVLQATGIGSATFGSGYDDFSSADAAVNTTLLDADLQYGITALRSANNFLFIIGDNSVKQIGSISISASGATLFTITTLSSDQGTIWLNTVVSYNRLLLFANATGVFAVFGSSVEKISDKMDGIFKLINFNVPMCAAVNDVNQIHTFLLLVSYADPILGNRSLILAFAQKRWYVMSQGSGLVAITSANLGGHYDTFGSSTNDITQLIQSTTGPVAYQLSTALTAHGDPIHDKRIVQAGVAQASIFQSDLRMLIETENGSANTNIQSPIPNAVQPPLSPPAPPPPPPPPTPPDRHIIWQNNFSQVMSWVNNVAQTIQWGDFPPLPPPPPAPPPPPPPPTPPAAPVECLSHSSTAGITGRYVGATLTGTLNGIEFNAVYLAYALSSPWGKG